MTLTFDRGTRRLEGIRYEIDGRSRLVVERTPKGVHARRTTLPYVIEVKGAAGRIDRGLYADAVAAGVPDRVVSELAQIFEWKVDFGSDLRPGDEYRVLYENIWEAGGHAGEPGKVLGAEIVTRGKPMTAVFFEDADGQGGYYDPDGESLASDFLRYPCEFRKITSLFSRGRRHPVLGRRRPHLAVDFAAPYGTPVHAVATGKVDSTGWLRQLGRYIRVDHADALRSTYGHLARIAPGIRAGSTVARGQVIGYVGRTGLATGNHLHFAIDRDGEPVDPLTALAHAPSRVPAVARRAFERARQAVVRSLGALPRTERPMTVSLAGARAE